MNYKLGLCNFISRGTIAAGSALEKNEQLFEDCLAIARLYTTKQRLDFRRRGQFNVTLT